MSPLWEKRKTCGLLESLPLFIGARTPGGEGEWAELDLPGKREIPERSNLKRLFSLSFVKML